MAERREREERGRVRVQLAGEGVSIKLRRGRFSSKRQRSQIFSCGNKFNTRVYLKNIRSGLDDMDFVPILGTLFRFWETLRAFLENSQSHCCQPQVPFFPWSAGRRAKGRDF